MVMTPMRGTATVVIPSGGRGGVERHGELLSSALVALGQEVQVVLMEQSDTPVFAAPGAEIVSVGDPAGAGPLGLLSSSRRLRDVLRRRSPETLITMGFRADLIARPLGHLRGARVISWKHNCGHVAHFGLRDRLVERMWGRLTDSYVAVCQSQVRYLVDYLGIASEKIVVVYNWLGDEHQAPAGTRAAQRLELGIPGDSFVVGVPAVLREWKGHRTILEAWAEVASRAPGARLLLIGDGEERGHIAAEVKRLGLEPNVMMLGDRSDVRVLMAACDAVALGSYAVECFPFALLEAMAEARPVVATAVGGVPEMVEDGVTGFVVPPRSSAAMARALLCLQADPERARQMGSVGRARLLSRFSAHAMQRRVGTMVGREVGA